MEFGEVKKCNGVVGTGVGNLFEPFQDCRDFHLAFLSDSQDLVIQCIHHPEGGYDLHGRVKTVKENSS